MQCPHCQSEIPDAQVLSAAGRIAVARRRTHKGAARQAYACRWCKAECRGRAALEAHERGCDQRSGELIEINTEDMAALGWPGPDAA
jgi:hypothetical protein